MNFQLQQFYNFRHFRECLKYIFYRNYTNRRLKNMKISNFFLNNKKKSTHII
jgi:hypothetical protein